MTFADDFEGDDLDRSVWIPHYLPQWSSRAESAATYDVRGSELRLSIPPEQGLWCPVEHEGPLRVSAVQSGVSNMFVVGPVQSAATQAWSQGFDAVREGKSPLAALKTAWHASAGQLSARVLG